VRAHRQQVSLPDDFPVLVLEGTNLRAASAGDTFARNHYHPCRELHYILSGSGVYWVQDRFTSSKNRPSWSSIPANAITGSTPPRLNINESWGDREIADTLAAINKVEKAYLK